MADLKIAYGAHSQTVTITVNSLGSNSSRASTAIDNNTTQFIDVLVSLTTVTTTSATTGYVNVFVAASVDNGTNYTENASGTDAAITLTAPSNARLIGSISTPAASSTYKGGPFSVAAAFGGTLPAKFVIIIDNRTGAALGGSGNSVTYQGVYGQY